MEAMEVDIDPNPAQYQAGPSIILETANTQSASSSKTASNSPLHLDLRHQCLRLVRDLGYLDTSKSSLRSQIPQDILQYAYSSDALVPPSRLLESLANLAEVDGFALLVFTRFQAISCDLIARWLCDTDGLDISVWQRRLFVLAELSEPRPDLWSHIIAFLQRSPFSSSPLSIIPSDQLISTPPVRLHPLLLAYNRLLTADIHLAQRNNWPIGPLHQLRSHPDTGVRLLAIQILAKQCKWSEMKRMEVEKQWIGDVETIDAEVLFGSEIVLQPEGGFEVRKVVVDGWMLPLLEARRSAAYAKRLQAAQSQEVYSDHATLTPSDLCPRTAVVGGCLLLRAAVPPVPTMINITHVPTSATSSATRTMIPRLQLGLPVLLTSPPSSGKTHILHYLSSEIHPTQQPTNRILTIPLADTTIDVKSLIGTYVSSPTKPGTFEWMEGALAKAVRAGRWVLFDDIDRASMEMLVTIAGLARSLQQGRAGRRARLAVPGRDEIEAGDGFALFATRTSRQGASIPSSFFGHQHFREVQLEVPSDDDVRSILTARFPALPMSATTALVEVWRDLRPLAKVGGQGKTRDIGLRDLEKWCARVQRNLPPVASIAALEQSGAGVFANPVFPDEVLLEAADTFIASLDFKPSSSEKAAQMLQIVAERIGMDEERAFGLINNRKPQIEVSTASRMFRIGRTSLEMAPSPRRREVSSSRPFALTKPSLVLLERIAASAIMGEPTLLVGETGTGKTTAVQYIATTCRKPLTVLNLSTQTESSDLLGGYKPIDALVAARALHARWQALFVETFSMGKSQNGTYLEAASKALNLRKWDRCASLWASSARRAVDKLDKKEEILADEPKQSDGNTPRKRRKVNDRAAKAAVAWQTLLVDITDFDLHHVKMKSKLVFSFVEGPLVKALKAGEWILLDEVNLASQETLEAISTILEGTAASLVLTERGDVEPIPRHPDFRLFACMNPATDVGKKDLPPNLRARFTELYVPPPDDDREALITIVAQYLGDAAAGDRGVILDVVEMYTTLKRLSTTKEIVDGSNIAPHYSMRTLARALSFAVETAPVFGLRRGLWEGCLMSFTMSLHIASAKRAHEVCERHILTPMKNARAVLAQIPTLPRNVDPDDFVRFGPFWLRRGPVPPVAESRYIITSSVQSKLSDLARVILTHRYPVLIQGPTSAGKTSAVEFLARQTGHRFVRINNHEHTDIQEYLGTYVTDPQTGNLVFQEGLLVTAVRQGHWIVLDELNLAPTDVLEALNRLLDDNHELIIPETQEVITPHPNFILFATQNPPGLYAGRKVLSRAFRNRFLEVHFGDVPKDELETILCQRCQIAPSYAKRIVQVFEELRHRRQASRVFESKTSFATLRDLFRWAERGAVGYQQLAEDGYMLLAERARQDEDKLVIKEVIEEIMKVAIHPRGMYDLFNKSDGQMMSRLPFTAVPPATMVWTRAMQRLFALVAAALARNEPVLLVGETGCGKTSVCEVIAQAFTQKLVGVNCHQNMETADLLGSQRPVRNRLERRTRIISILSGFGPIPQDATVDELFDFCNGLLKGSEADGEVVRTCQREIKQLSALFEWSDGPLVHAMTDGDLLLLDEVSLADDSVLERLNSVLEPGRTLVLAEKGGVDIDAATLVAHSNFHVVATMNPGGDFGKKELSPALRNRFTEIWVPPLNDREDLLQIIGQSWTQEEARSLGPLILDFFEWFGERIGDKISMGLRDILAWVNFSDLLINRRTLDISSAFHHGGQMVVVDGLESLPAVAGLPAKSIAFLRDECLNRLTNLASSLLASASPMQVDLQVNLDKNSVSIGGFGIARGPLVSETSSFRFEAPTTALNAMRVLRGCQLPKAILLEGSPGVGKTSLVSALAGITGHHLQRINLSDQTDLIDLFGSDLPVEGGQAGEFQWRDAAFLNAMQRGHWVLLDEMNLASQTVLEGLNAVLDHRGAVFIPELGRSFDRHPDFRIFAAQNPLQQGGGRKGLPKSFLNRFTKVYLQEHTAADLLLICRDLHPMPEDLVQKMITFNEIIRERTMISRTIGREGSPWEFNLRDLFRWFRLLSKANGLERTSHPVEFLRMIYLQRFRNDQDRLAVEQIFVDVFQCTVEHERPMPFITPDWCQIGHSMVRRSGTTFVDDQIRHNHLDVAESVLKSVEMGWLVILAGDNGLGKRRLLRGVAAAAGRSLGEFVMHPGVDTSEILGSFEQQDTRRLFNNAHTEITRIVEQLSDIDHSIQEAIELYIPIKDAYARSRTDAALAKYEKVSRSLINQCSGQSITLATIAIETLAKAGSHAGGFVWVDGQLLDAIRSGGWYLITDANLCSPSVLDRLNSLCESDGVLVMSEKGSSTGSPEVIKPHPDFRLFMTYDPRHGELSRAMRNRGVELSVSPTFENMTNTISSPALADHAILHSINVEQGLGNGKAAEQYPYASAIANSIATRTRQALPLSRRIASCDLDLASTVMTGVAYVQNAELRVALDDQVESIPQLKNLPRHFSDALPLDISTHPQIREESTNSVFRILQLVLRNHAGQMQTQSWLNDSANAKSVLAVSSASDGGAIRRKQAAGHEVYPFTSSLRQTIHQHATALITARLTDNALYSIEQWENVLIFLHMLEDRAKSNFFDHSATQLLSEWLSECMKALPFLEPAMERLRLLAKAVKITTGFGQTQIWSCLRQGRFESGAEKAFVPTINGIEDPELRYSVVRALIASEGKMPQDLADTLRTLPLSPAKSPSENLERWNHWLVLSVMELSMLASGSGLGSASTEDTLRTIVSDTRTELSSLIDGAALSTDHTPGRAFAAIRTCLERMWRCASGDGQTLDGPAMVFSPAILSSALRFSARTDVKMAEIPLEADALDFAIKAVLWQAKKHDIPEDNAATVILDAVSMILAALDIDVSSGTSAASLISAVTTAPPASTEWILPAFTDRLKGPLEALQEVQPSPETLAAVYLGTAQFLISMYVTNIPIDPTVRRTLLGDVITRQLQDLELEQEAVLSYEAKVTGLQQSHRLARLQTRITAKVQEEQDLGPSPIRRLNVARLVALFNEIHTFIGDTMSQSNLSLLIAALKAGEVHALQREDGFQLGSAAFIQRLSSQYGDLPDLIQPIIVATHFAKFGLRCAARGLEQRGSQASPTVAAVLSFPSCIAADALRRLPAHEGNAIEQVITAATLARETFSDSERGANLPSLVRRMDALYQLWSQVRLREERDAQAAESLYRVRKTDGENLSDPEIEEREFAELFPQYDEENMADPRPLERKADIDNKFPMDHIIAFGDLIRSVSGIRRDDAASAIYSSYVDRLLSSRHILSVLPTDIDGSSLAYSVATLHRRRAATSTPANQPNFYTAPNEIEIRKAHDILLRLKDKLEGVIEEWPEQMVLQHIWDRCRRILYLDRQSPVAMILAAMEQLLVHTDDWESYANRENTLKQHQAEISAIIIQWRRLELSTWMTLLDDQAKQYISQDGEWTLRLYGALVQGAMAASDIKSHVETVLPMITTYLTTSSIGHFDHRLSVLLSLERMSNEICGSLISGAAQLEPISRMLHNVIANATLFVAKVKDTFDNQRSSIDKSIKDFVKLASWKDVNVFALKASAQKSHRQLHRSIRKFRDVLRQPVAPTLSDLHSICPQERPQSLELHPAASIDVEGPLAEALEARNTASEPVPQVLQRMNETYRRFARVLQYSSCDEKTSESLDDMAIEIIETAATLAKETPSASTKENAKVIKNLASRKRKAFADMLKALRESSFSSSVRADALARQHSSVWLYDRPSLAIRHDLPTGEAQILRKIDGYHHRLVVLMPALRAAFNGHNPDIASQDLQRGIGFVESMFATAIHERDSLAHYLNELSRLSFLTRRLEQCSNGTEVLAGRVMQQDSVAVEVVIGRLQLALSEVEEGIRQIRDLQKKPTTESDISDILSLKQECQDLVRALSQINGAMRTSGCLLMTQGEAGFIRQGAVLLARSPSLLTKMAKDNPELSHLLGPVAEICVTNIAPAFSGNSSALTDELWLQADDVIRSLLVLAQHMPSDESTGAGESEYPHVSRSFGRQRDVIQSFHVSDILTRVTNFVDHLIHHVEPNISAAAVLVIQYVTPFLHVVTDTLARRVSQHSRTIASTYKLCYVVGRIQLDLAEKGFCKPSEGEDAGDADAEGDTVDGTGLGTGSGLKNVSSEIEEEGQVEGLQGEEDEPEEEDGAGDDDDAVSMENDFDGKLGDGKEDEGDDDGDDDGDSAPDEHVGDVDPLDPGAVDEKFWGDEKQEEAGNSEEMADGQTKETGEAEVSAKEDVKQHERKKDTTDTQHDETQHDDTQHDDNQEEDTQHDDDGQDGDGTDDNEARPPVNQDEVVMPEGDNLDLPENLDLDDKGDDQHDEPDDSMEVDEDGVGDDSDEKHDDRREASADDGMDVEDGPSPTGVADDEANEPETIEQGQQSMQEDESSAQNSTDAPDGNGGNGLDGEHTGEENSSEGLKDRVEARQTDPEASESNRRPAEQNEVSATDSGHDALVDATGAPLPSENKAQSEIRSLGDLLQDIRRRRDDILEQQEREAPKKDSSEQASGQVEYVQDDQEAESQALGAAGEDQRQKLAELNILDDDTGGEEPPNGFTDQEDPPVTSPPSAEASADVKQENRDISGPPVEKAITRNEIHSSFPGSAHQQTSDNSPMDEDYLATSEREPSPDMEIELKDVKAEDVEDLGSEDLWRQYAALTSDLSYALCEQLRLILEPTLATRLQGDFRTGKRLNMRKIIPYIASEYTKDKIWLRRTKPSRREYQVLLSVDDSRSMAESRSVHLAHQTLALVAQALNKLEVGQISIARFGESVDILHPFGDTGFTDSDGANVMRAFHFDQHRTDVAALVERTLAFLSEARQRQTSSVSAPDLWQLQIIISDGICQDHGRLRTLLRRAVEERVMIVFIVVDSLQPADKSASTRPSILSMQTVEYKNVNGEMQLDMQRYLDTFPFEFYVVLRDVETLPGVLADTLRQWMARVSQSQE